MTLPKSKLPKLKRETAEVKYSNERPFLDDLTPAEHEYYALRVLERRILILQMQTNGQIDRNTAMNLYIQTGSGPEVLRDRQAINNHDLEANPTYSLALVAQR